jgi:predicted nucleotidyltransferase
LPGIVILKLLAWDDRPEVRRDDIKDISDILRHFFDMYDNEIWENHSDLFGDDYIDTLHTVARVMGREMKKIAKRNDKLFTRIEGIINDNTANVEKSKIAVIMNEYFQNTVEENFKLLNQLKKGFTE